MTSGMPRAFLVAVVLLAGLALDAHYAVAGMWTQVVCAGNGPAPIEGMTPLSQTPLFTPDDTLDDVVDWLGGRDGLVLRNGEMVGAIGAADVERWYRRVVEGRTDPPAGLWSAVGSTGAGASTTDTVPPRPDI